MAVYTKFYKKDFENILTRYSIGQLENFLGIKEGIENTNYIIKVNNKKYILTVYEKRVKEEDLPFFSGLMLKLNDSSFKCPVPILNKDDLAITEYKEKKLMISSFLEGNYIK